MQQSHPPSDDVNFAGRQLVRRLAVGGMAEVFLADEPRPVGEPRRVVLKRLLPEVATHAAARSMFESEGKLGAFLKHPNIVEVRETGKARDGLGNERAYLTMEYVRGVDSWQLVRWTMSRGEAMSIPLALLLGDSILAGLAFAHEAKDDDGSPLQIVHRDVSPSNILLSQHGEIKLGDFGIAQSALRVHDDDFEEEKAKGKLGYLSPEQVRGEPCGAATDIFSAAVIIAEALIGKPLFAGGSELAILLAIRDAQISAFTDMLGHLPPGLGESIIGALQANPENRIQSAREFRETLQVFQKEDLSEVQKQLATLVGQALHGRAGTSVESAPDDEQESTGRVTLMEDIRAPVTPRTPHVSVKPAPADRAPITSLEAVLYQVRREGAATLELSYADVVERISDGRINDTDLISKDDGDFVEASKLPELARHLAGGITTTREVMRSTESDRVIQLEGGALVRLLAEAAHRKETGLWILVSGDVRKEVYLEEGKPRFVTSNKKNEMLGEYLVETGVIGRNELDMALAVMPRYEGRLGDTLTALGLVEAVHLFQHIEEQVRSKLLEAFTWTEGQASYYAGVEPPKSAFPLEIEPWELIGEGCRRRVQAGLEDARFEGRSEQSVVLRTDYDPSLLFEKLPSEAQLLLMTIERPRRFDDIDSAMTDESGASVRMRSAIVFLLELKIAKWVA